jgi:D-inositol-3-phosphate glycosyltransferase
MISFVWSSKYPFIAGSGGSESYTAGQIHELQRRGIECRILTIGHGTNDGRRDFPDIKFHALKSKEELSQLDDTIIFITYPLNVKTKQHSYVILHCPPPAYGNDPLYDLKGIAGKKLIATSGFAARMWARYYAKESRSILLPGVVYPFAEPAFSKVSRRPSDNNKTRVLFAGRLTADKGIYTLLAALHMADLKELDFELTCTNAGSYSEDGAVIEKMLRSNPWIKVVKARRSPEEMAALMAKNDIVVMPTTDIFWKESFGIISVEAQHAGCRVVASRAGGLAESNCGGLILVRPDDPLSLANGIIAASKKGALTPKEREKAVRMFTVEKSVDDLLKLIKYPKLPPQKERLHKERVLLAPLYSKRP